MFNRVLSHLRPDADSEEELSAAELKKQRIKFHRDHVRNGPSNFRTISTGQQRRAQTRAQEAGARKTNRRYRRQWMAQQADAATLRGHLVILGVLECKDEHTTFADHHRQASLEWVTQKYGPRDDDGQLVLDDKLVPTAVANARDAFLQTQKPVKA